MKQTPVVGIENGTATGGQYQIVLGSEVADDLRFALAKAGLALDFKDQRDRSAGARLDFMIGIDKSLVQAFCQCPPYCGFASPHQADQKNIPAHVAKLSLISGSNCHVAAYSQHPT